jgi:hypothetical protein
MMVFERGFCILGMNGDNNCSFGFWNWQRGERELDVGEREFETFTGRVSEKTEERECSI